MIQDKILKMAKVDWKTIEEIQPDNIKQVRNRDAIKSSIDKYGFAMPFAVWQDKQTKEIFTVDGHIRKEVLMEMGKDVPKLLPAVFIDAKDKQEAIKILLEVYNMKSNPFKMLEMEQWLTEENLDLEEISFTQMDVFDNRTNKGRGETQIGDNQVTEKDVLDAQNPNTPIATGHRRIAVICPECLHEFEIQ